MKKVFIILVLLIAFNFASPNSRVLTQIAKHQIEFTQEDKSRDLTNNEILKNKVVMYMRMKMLGLKVTMVNVKVGFNSS